MNSADLSPRGEGGAAEMRRFTAFMLIVLDVFPGSGWINLIACVFFFFINLRFT
jgi:hypothetical protein